jgi:hypothetical protein
MTAADLIRISLRTLGVLAAEETPSAAEQSDALETLNDMLDSWAGERLALFATLRSTHTLTVGLSPQTIGSGGTFNTTRPVRIDGASITPARHRDGDAAFAPDGFRVAGDARENQHGHPLPSGWSRPTPS